MNKDNMASIIENYLRGTDQVLSRDQLIILAKQIREPMWKWHIYIGYVLVGLFCFRFLSPLFGEMKIANPLDKSLHTKEKFQKWIYIIFYVSVVVSLVTGLFIEFGPKDLKKPMEALHKLSVYYLVPFIVIHLTGVLIAEFTTQKGIVSSIVSGKKFED